MKPSCNAAPFGVLGLLMRVFVSIYLFDRFNLFSDETVFFKDSTKNGYRIDEIRKMTTEFSPFLRVTC